MLEPLSCAAAAARAQVIAAALALGRSLDLWSLVLFTVALVSILWLSLPLLPTIFLLASLLAGGAQKICALRVAFDAALFCHWAEVWRSQSSETSVAQQKPDTTALMADLASLDQVLTMCGMRAAPDSACRDLDSRLRGAWGLLRQQILTCAIQCAALLGAIVAVRLLPAG
ncbi:MAG: hypothetical protein ACOH2K_07305 [Burkholderiaceae bacterium]